MNAVDRLHDAVYAPAITERVERAMVIMATIAFVLHLALIAAIRFSIGPSGHWFSSSYLAALYTPFSFLLFYEVLLLVAALPKSFSRSVGLQLEVVMLIVIRRVFKDIAHLDGAGEIVLENPVILEALADMAGALVLFVLVRRFRGEALRKQALPMRTSSSSSGSSGPWRWSLVSSSW